MPDAASSNQTAWYLGLKPRLKKLSLGVTNVLTQAIQTKNWIHN